MLCLIFLLAFYNSLVYGLTLKSTPTHLVGNDVKIWSRHSLGKTSYIHKNMNLNKDNKIEIENSVDFLNKYSSYFGLKDSKFEFKQLRNMKLPNKDGITSIDEFQTYLYGRRVFRGKIKVGKESNGNAVHAHGHPLPELHLFNHQNYKHLSSSSSNDVVQPLLSFEQVMTMNTLKAAVVERLTTNTYNDIIFDEKKAKKSSNNNNNNNMKLLSELKTIFELNTETTVDVDNVELVWYRRTVHGTTLNEEPFLAYEIKGNAKKIKNNNNNSINTKITSKSDSNKQLDVVIAMKFNAYIDSNTGKVLEIIDARSLKNLKSYIISNPNPVLDKKEKEYKNNLRLGAIRRKLQTIPQPDITLRPVRVLNCQTPGYDYDDCSCADTETNSCTVLYDTTAPGASNDDLEAYNGDFPDETRLIIYTTVQFSLFLTSITNNLRTAPWFDTLPGEENANKPFNAHIGLSIANAYYTEDQIFFGGGLETDDVVSHEWAHGLTEYDNELVYMYEPGALNEAYSDIIGESIDLENEVFVVDDRMTTTRATNPPACVNGNNNNPSLPQTDTSERFVMGEEIINPSMEGGIRDMFYPECFGHPGTMDSAYYRCDTTVEGMIEAFNNGEGESIGLDNFWVHVHSGIKNHLFAMLYNGFYDSDSNTDVTAISPTKLYRLFYETSALLSFDSSFEDYISTLNSACTTLTDQELYTPDLQTGTSVAVDPAERINVDDCETVTRAATITKMLNANDFCGLQNFPVAPEFVQPLCRIGDIWKTTLFDPFFRPYIGWSCNYDSNNVPSFPIDPCVKFGAWSGLFCKSDATSSTSVITGINLNLNVLGMNLTDTIQQMPDFTPFKATLQMLLMQYNQINLPFPNWQFKELSSLTHVDLIGHRFSGGLDDDLFNYLPNLQYFDYSYIGNFPVGFEAIQTGTPFPSSYCTAYTTPNQIQADFSGVTFSECVPECAKQQQTTIGTTNAWCGSGDDDDDNSTTIIIAVVSVVGGLLVGAGLAWFGSSQGWWGNNKREPSMNRYPNSSDDGRIPTAKANRL